MPRADEAYPQAHLQLTNALGVPPGGFFDDSPEGRRAAERMLRRSTTLAFKNGTAIKFAKRVEGRFSGT